jgi:ABC-2 type transport system permease protein
MTGTLGRALRAEWTKLRSVRSTTWMAVAVVAISVGLTAFLATKSGTDANRAGGGSGDDDVVVNGLRGVWYGQVAMVALGAVAATSEFVTGTIRATFAAMPRRVGAVGAKVAVVGALALAVGSVASVLSFVIAQPLLHEGGYNPPAYPHVTLRDASTMRAVAGTAIHLTLLALFAVGVGTIVRHTAAAMTTVVGLVLVPTVVMESFPRSAIRDLLQHFVPSSGLSIQVTAPAYDTPPFGPWGGLGVTAAWAVVALLVAAWSIWARDV